MNAAQTLGTWTNGTDTLTVAYFEAGHVRLDNSRGEALVVDDEEWMDRYDALRDAGWYRLTRA